MTSLNAPLSAFYKVYFNFQTGSVYAEPITPSNAQAVALDNLMYARAIKILPIITTLPYTSSSDTMNLFFDGALKYTGVNGVDWLHFLGSGFPYVSWYKYTDAQTGQTIQIFIGDYITVNYPGGYSMKWQFQGPGYTTTHSPWKPIPSTLMQNGVPVKPPSTTPAKPYPGFGSFNEINNWPSGHIITESDLNFCFGVSSITVGPIGGSTLTGFGVFSYPC